MESTIYFGWTFIVVFLTGVFFYYTFTQKIMSLFSTKEIIIVFLFVGLLFLCRIPFRIIGGIFVFRAIVTALPYGIIMLIGIQLVPKPGTATLLICGEAFLSQIIATGLNPIWWPMYLTMSFVIESYCLLVKDYGTRLANAALIGAIKGFLGNFYFYIIGAPFIFHQFYPSWYILLHICLGTIATIAGSIIGYRLFIIIKKGIRMI